DAYRDDDGNTEESIKEPGKPKSLCEKIREKYEDGIHAVIVGKQYAQSWNESIDKVISILHSEPGRGMTRRPGMKPVATIQDRINQTLNYMAQSMDTGSPSIWVNSQI